MLRVAIVGCGKIADQHVEQIAQIPDCEIVGVCDQEILMAEQLQQRLKSAKAFTDVQRLLEEAKPNVVHITTPPASHYPLGKMCLNNGCHVYVEKPFTVDLTEAEKLITLAMDRGLKLTVGHNAQFSHASIKMRQILRTGYLGGPPIHLEAFYCYSLADPGYAKALLGDSRHWVRKLPGGLLQNVISHGISKISEFLQDDHLEVMAFGFTSKFLKSIGETEIIDELRTVIYDGNATAYFTFSSQMRPALHELRIYGPKNGLIVNDDQQTVIKVKGAAYKSYLEQFLPQWEFANQYARDSLGNMTKFLRSDFQANYGMKLLITGFYRSITEGIAVPIPYEEILRTSRIMDEIFDRIRPARSTKFLDDGVLASHER